MKIFRRRGGDDRAAATVAAGSPTWAWRTAHLSVRGASHLRGDIECQDHSASRTFDADRGAYIIVADGHGSASHFRSERGARFAVDAMAEVFTTFRQLMDELGSSATVATSSTHWADAARPVVSNWRSQVYEDLLRDPPRVPDRKGGEPGVARFFDYVVARRGYAQLHRLLQQFSAFEEYTGEFRSHPPDDRQPLLLTADPRWDSSRFGSWQVRAYGTTLLGVLIGPDSLHWLQLGDGAMIKIVGGRAAYLVPPPGGAIANETPSLCDDDAVAKIQLGTVPIVAGDVPSGLVLATDGLPNSYEEDAGFFEFCQEIVQRAGDGVGIARDLRRWLPEISERGSGDDVTVALAWADEVPQEHLDADRVENLPSDGDVMPEARDDDVADGDADDVPSPAVGRHAVPDDGDTENDNAESTAGQPES